jgi:glutamate N-acetyltransferase/amino-acid N-acetyltransferase
MSCEIVGIESGTITSSRGFSAGAVKAGVKYANRLDVGVLVSEVPCVAAGVFTRNRVKSAAVQLCRSRLQADKAQAIVVNSGCANACVGEHGFVDANTVAVSAAIKLGVESKMVLIASTGVIGVPLPVERINRGLSRLVVGREGGHDFARAMMTTDRVPKEVAVKVRVGSKHYHIGAVAKGSGMIHPDMATMLCFISTDAMISAACLNKSLVKAVNSTFNMISVDGDTSPSDSVIMMANGLSGLDIEERKETAEAFQEALTRICLTMAKAIARDGEGATKLIEVLVEKAVNRDEAVRAARTVTTSPLVKTAIHGCDPNWGRIICAIGRSEIDLDLDKADVYLAGEPVLKAGIPVTFDKAKLKNLLAGSEISIRINLNLGRGEATAWGCDLSKEYVSINADYTT